MQHSGTSALPNGRPYTSPLFTWADALMCARHLGNPTHPHMGRTLGPIEQNHAIMQKTPSTYRSSYGNTVVSCMDNRKEPHPQHPSITNLSFTVTFTQDAAALFLKRAKNVKLADKDCKRLTTEIVQSVVNKIANGADKHALSFLRGTTTSVEQRSAYLRVPTALALSTTSTLPSYDMITPGENQALF